MKKFTVPRELVTASNINGYSEDDFQAKEAFHKNAKRFLKSLAVELGGSIGEFTIRSNKAGPAVSGEVTLHSDNLYVQLAESCMDRGISMLYRSCKSQKDYSGNRNHQVRLSTMSVDDSVHDRVLAEMRSLVGSEVARKQELNAIAA